MCVKEKSEFQSLGLDRYGKSIRGNQGRELLREIIKDCDFVREIDLIRRQVNFRENYGLLGVCCFEREWLLQKRFWNKVDMSLNFDFFM